MHLAVKAEVRTPKLACKGMEEGFLEEGMIVYAFRDERVRQMKENVGEKTCMKEPGAWGKGA